MAEGLEKSAIEWQIVNMIFRNLLIVVSVALLQSPFWLPAQAEEPRRYRPANGSGGVILILQSHDGKTASLLDQDGVVKQLPIDAMIDPDRRYILLSPRYKPNGTPGLNANEAPELGPAKLTLWNTIKDRLAGQDGGKGVLSKEFEKYRKGLANSKTLEQVKVVEIDYVVWLAEFENRIPFIKAHNKTATRDKQRTFLTYAPQPAAPIRGEATKKDDPMAEAAATTIQTLKNMKRNHKAAKKRLRKYGGVKGK